LANIRKYCALTPVYLTQYPDTRARFEKVAKLVEGFESPFGLELLASTHWVIEQENGKPQKMLYKKFIHGMNVSAGLLLARFQLQLTL
jgi:hypothetical protein